MSRLLWEFRENRPNGWMDQAGSLEQAEEHKVALIFGTSLALWGWQDKHDPKDILWITMFSITVFESSKRFCVNLLYDKLLVLCALNTVRYQVETCPGSRPPVCHQPCFSPAQKIWKIAKLFNSLTPHFRTSQFTVFVICFSNTFVTFIMCLEFFFFCRIAFAGSLKEKK